MAVQLDVTPPNTPPRAFLFSCQSSSGDSAKSGGRGIQAWRWVRYTLVAFALSAFVFGWPNREAIGQLWRSGKDRWRAEDPMGAWTAEDVASHGGSWRSSGPSASAEDISTSRLAATDPTLDYRRRLELTTSPPGYLEHSRHLGFSRVYVLTLPHRTDRRATMERIAAALGIEVTFVDAVTKDSPVIGWIAERAAEVRQLKRKAMAEHMGVDESRVGGSPSVWLSLDASKGGSRSNQGPLRDITFPSLAKAEFGGRDWVSHLWDPKTDHSTLRPRDPHFNVTEAMRDPLEQKPLQQVSLATLSTFYNHVRLLRDMDAKGDATALVLEDDVDVEWDIERRWKTMLARLPRDWEAVFLGHCWGRELFGPSDPLSHPQPHELTSMPFRRTAVPSPQPAQVDGAAVPARPRDLPPRPSPAPLPLLGPLAGVPDAGRHLLPHLHRHGPARVQRRAADRQPGQDRHERHPGGHGQQVVRPARRLDAGPDLEGSGEGRAGEDLRADEEGSCQCVPRPRPGLGDADAHRPTALFRYCRPDDNVLRLSPLQCPQSPRRSRHKPH